MTPVQELTFGPIVDGKDIFAQAETGSGKTAAFAVPILELLISGDMDIPVSQGRALYIVLSPTRELAQQTHSVFQTLGKPLNITSACIIGGESIEKQKELLGNGAHILVATPGRLADLIRQNQAKVNDCLAVVFDEADRLFDMGFKKEIEFILSEMPNDRQIIMVSATSNYDVLHTAYKYNSHPEELKVNQESILVETIDHNLVMVGSNEKFAFLANLLQKQSDSYAIVFCNTQFNTHLVAEWLKAMGMKASPISGRLPQHKRTKLLADFRSKDVTILVCTDVAARGLDIKDVPLVVNYDMPSEAANYVHRIGRTGRAGKDGKAFSLCAPEDCQYLEPIQEYIGSKIPHYQIADHDLCRSICKRPYIDRKSLRVVDRETGKPIKPSSSPSGRRADDRLSTDKPITQKGRTMTTPEPKTAQARRSERIRHLEITTSCPKDLTKKALKHFNIEDEELLKVEVLKQGRKKFIVFGPRHTTYRVEVRPIFKRLLQPFLKGLFEMANLELEARVSFRDPQVRISIAGNDAGLLFRDRCQLLDALDTVIRRYLGQKLNLEENIKILVEGPKKEDRPQRAAKPAPRAERVEQDQRDDSEDFTDEYSDEEDGELQMLGPKGDDEEVEGHGDREPNGDQERPRRQFSRERRPNQSRGPRDNRRNPRFDRGERTHRPNPREKDLIEMAKRYEREITEKKQPILIEALNSADRRIIHQYFQDHAEITTTSLGEGQIKTIELSLK